MKLIKGENISALIVSKMSQNGLIDFIKGN